MSDCVSHRWLLVPGGEIDGMMHLGHWVCVNCGRKGPSSRFKCPGLDWTHQSDRLGVCRCTSCVERK